MLRFCEGWTGFMIKTVAPSSSAQMDPRVSLPEHAQLKSVPND